MAGGDAKAGMGADLGVRKINDDGDVEEERGFVSPDKSMSAWILFYIMIFLSLMGLWQIVELILQVV